MNKIDFQTIVKGVASLQNLELDARSKGYLKSYPSYLKFFQGSEIRDHDDFTVRAGLVYSWMPRILVLKEQGIGNAISVISHLQNPDTESNTDIDSVIEAVAKALNRSYVGASKFLHFQFPDIFPIYDTKVYKKINGINADKKNIYSKANNADCYASYRRSVCSIIAHADFSDKVHTPVNNYMRKFGYTVSEVRAVEFIVFSNYQLPDK
jgi:hypothetical protein